MRGVLIHYNYETEQGLIRAEDGRRYAFYGREWRADARPNIGDEIDFEVEGSTAYDVYLLKAAAAPAPARPARDITGRPARDITGGPARDITGGVTRDPPAPQGDGTGRRSYWAGAIALVTLAGCLLPYISFNAQSTSLFGVAPAISEAVDGLAQVERFGRVMGGPPGALRSQNAPINVTGITWSLGFGYVLYIVPILSILVAALAFLKRPMRRLAFWHALSSIVLPIVVPLGVGIAVYEQVSPQMRQMLSSSPLINPDFNFTGFGFWVIVLSGVAQFLNWLFFRKRWTQEATAGTPATASR